MTRPVPVTDSPHASRPPAVSVVMPVRDEADGLAAAVESVRAQRYDGELEIVLAVAPSTDGTERVAADLEARGLVKVVANPGGTTPAGLNAAIRAASGDVIVRLDGHAELSDGYIRRAVETLARTGAVNVGGIQRATGVTPFECAVAEAMSSRFGTGDAVFHYGGEEGPTDTVYLGVFDRAALDAVGAFDERLIRNQDYELNIRLRDAGGVVWFDPKLEVRYRPRGSLRALARQYFDYGRWKRVVVTEHPRSLRWRQVVPPLTSAAVTLAAAMSLRWRRAALVPGGYLAAVSVASVLAGSTPAQRARLLVIFPVMHLSWGFGFVFGRTERQQR